MDDIRSVGHWLVPVMFVLSMIGAGICGSTGYEPIPPPLVLRSVLAFLCAYGGVYTIVTVCLSLSDQEVTDIMWRWSLLVWIGFVMVGLIGVIADLYHAIGDYRHPYAIQLRDLKRQIRGLYRDLGSFPRNYYSEIEQVLQSIAILEDELWQRRWLPYQQRIQRKRTAKYERSQRALKTARDIISMSEKRGT